MSNGQNTEAGLGTTGAEPPAPEPPASALTDSAFGRLAGVLFSPLATFASIRRRPTWVVAFAAILAISLAAQFLAFDKLDSSEVRDQIAEAMEQQQGAPPSDAELERTVDLQMKVSAGCAALFLPLSLLVVALVFMVVLRMSGGELTFVQSLATTVHAMVPLAVGGVLAILVLLGRSTPLGIAEAQHRLLASNLSVFAPEGASQIVLTLLSSIDVFSLWVVALLIVGFGIVAGVKRSTATVVTLSLWALWIVLKVGLAALGQAFGGG